MEEFRNTRLVYSITTESHDLKCLIVNMLECVAEAKMVHSLCRVIKPHFLGNSSMVDDIGKDRNCTAGD